MKRSHLIKKIYREKTIEKATSKIKLLGVNCHYDVIDLLNIRLLITIFIVGLFLIFSKRGFIYAPVFGVGFYVFSEYLFIDLRIKKREKKLEEEAIFFFEVLALTLESGRNLKAALDITAMNIESDLSDEFRHALAEVKLGKSFTESLKDMKERIPSSTINNAILNLTQASIFGNNITASLQNQLDFLREKQILGIKSEIAKLPTKISIVSVLFFIPIMLLVILSPVLIDFLLS